MKKLWIVLLMLCGCAVNDYHEEMKEWQTSNGKVKVLSTIAMINDLVKSIGGEHVDSIVLIKGELDPHSYQLVKGDDEKFVFAQLIFYNGLGLEHGPSLQHHLHTNPKAIALGDKVLEQNPDSILYQKGQLDPHIWMDVSMWSKTIPFILDALIKQDPEHAEAYKANAQNLMQELQTLHEKIHQELQSIPGEKRYLVTSHDAFNYFTRAYLASKDEASDQWQIRFAAPEGLAPESQLSVTDIQLIIDHLAKYNIHVLFPESNVSQDSIKKIVNAGKEKGLELTIAKTYLYADAMGREGSDGDTYIKMMKHNAQTIAQYLRG